MSRASLLRLALVAALAVAVAMAAVVSTSSGQGSADSAAQVQSVRCFGAASRDPERRCVNRDLYYSVVPTPEEAKSGQNSPCTPVDETAELYPCVFGTPWNQAVESIALIGDSHAGHWRAALDYVAEERRWHGISLTQTGCPFTKAVPILKGRTRDDCLGWNKEIQPWLERHPEIHTIFTSQHGGKVVVPPGETQTTAQISGFVQAFQDLPDTVEHVIVIRDTPWASTHSGACVAKTLRLHRRTDQSCALPRRRSLRPDLAAEAAVLMDDPRVEVLDFTPFMCDRRHCFPVVGGALVHKDGGHMTQVFSRTLGPYLGRAIDRLVARR